MIGRVIQSRKEELVLTIGIILILAVFSGCVVYYLENPVQPEIFPNIPTTLWWSLNTLAKVSTGSIYPATALGKVFVSFIGIPGIGLFALPTDIIGAGFVEELNKRKQPARQCPHCGKEIN